MNIKKTEHGVIGEREREKRLWEERLRRLLL